MLQRDTHKAGTALTVPLDDLDVRLIDLLADDASRTNVALARELGVSDVTVRNHMTRLMNTGAVKIVAVVDPAKIGRGLQLIGDIQVEVGRVHETAEALAALPQTTYVGYTAGENDLLMVASLRNEEELFHFLTEVVPSIPGVRRLRTSQVLKVLKRTFRSGRVLQTDIAVETSPDGNLTQ
jgi:Lrp/AsnC family transcriptional regulator for asnA, asnC and gidA